MEDIIFILLVVIVMVGMFYAISESRKQAVLYEEAYAKQIVLIIDRAEPEIEIELDIYKPTNIARKNGFSGQIININNEDNSVNVKLSNGKGYNYIFFNDVDIEWNLDNDKNNPKLFLKFIKSVENEQSI